jgi:hypothetical protein
MVAAQTPDAVSGQLLGPLGTFPNTGPSQRCPLSCRAPQGGSMSHGLTRRYGTCAFGDADRLRLFVDCIGVQCL